MSFYKFKDNDIVNIVFKAHPSNNVQLNGDQVTGSVELEAPFLDSNLTERFYKYHNPEITSDVLSKQGPFTSSIELLTAEYQGDENAELYQTLVNLYSYYSFYNSDYQPYFTGSQSTTFRIISIPEIYYDKEILSASFTASDINSDGDARVIYDNGRGGIYSGSLSGTLVGHIFYSEGIVVLTKGDLSDFGEASPTNHKWHFWFKGVHRIPTKIFKCRAPAGQLNASTNTTFYQIPASGDFKNQKEIVLDSPSSVYITNVGLYNEHYELVGVAKLAQPIKKELGQDILFRIRLDC